MEAPLVPDVLLQHGQFVRALARSLLRDGHAAEDLAQETWARYVERPPAAGRGLRPWLVAVTRNLAANLGRGQGRRATRERAAARAEAMPSAHAELEHAELVRVVAEAVLALEEPYRETIVARYYRGLDAQTLAARSGTNASTVRSREQRALEMLRERLDRKFGGERAAWAAVLARVAGPPVGEIAARPVWGWPLALVGAIPVLLFAVGIALWLHSRSPSEVSLAQSPAEIAAPSEPMPLELLEPPVLVHVSGDIGLRTPVIGEPAPVPLTNTSLAEIRGRFVFPGGAPAVDTAIRIDGWEADQERVLQFGKPEDWVELRTTAEADGSFSVRFDPPRAFQFSLDAKAPGHAEASWRWSEILPGATVDVGEIELPVGGTIEGRMIDAEGNALVGEQWTVYARTVGLGEFWDGRDDSQVIAPVHSATASFRLEDVWPCEVKLSGYSNLANNLEGPKVVVLSGETIQADIVYSGPSNASRITIVTFCEPFHTESNPEPGHMRLLGPSGDVRTAEQIEGSSQSYSFDDLEPGTYTVEIDDPRYAPWTRTGLVAGMSVQADLVGSAALRLSVIDAAGQPVERYAVRVTLRSSEWSPNEFELHDGATTLDDGLLRRLVPGDYTVAIRCPDGSSARCDVDGLASGETRDVRIELRNQLFIAGRVVHPDGEGVRRAGILLLTPAQQDDSDASPIMKPGDRTNWEHLTRWQLASVETDANGTFRFDVTRPGSYLLRARAEGSQVFSPTFSLENPRDGLELVLPRPGAVRGRVRGPVGASFEGLAVWIAPLSLCDSQIPAGLAGMQRMEDLRESIQHALAPLSADGSFEPRLLPPGPSRAFLVIEEEVRRSFRVMDDRGGIAGAKELGDLDVPAGDLIESDFIVAELPGWIMLELRVNGQPARFAGLRLIGPIDVDGRTDASGHFGPKRIPVGTWSVWAHDFEAGWNGFLPGEVLVDPGNEVSSTLDAQVISGAITCVGADGLPIANESVTVVRPVESNGAGVGHVPPHWEMLSPTEPVAIRKTDSNGRITLQLMPGEYALHRGDYWSWIEEPPPTVPFTWSPTGPLVERIQL